MDVDNVAVFSHIQNNTSPYLTPQNDKHADVFFEFPVCSKLV